MSILKNYLDSLNEISESNITNNVVNILNYPGRKINQIRYKLLRNKCERLYPKDPEKRKQCIQIKMKKTDDDKLNGYLKKRSKCSTEKCKKYYDGLIRKIKK